MKEELTYKPVTVFLNRVDLLEARMPHSSISDYFPDYKGGKDFEIALKFFEDYFFKAAHSGVVRYVHFINALDINDINEAFDAIVNLLSRPRFHATSNLLSYLQRPQNPRPSQLVKQMEWQKKIDKTMGSVRVNW